MVHHIEQLQRQDDGTCNYHYPCAFTSTVEQDTLHYGEMLTAPDRPQFAAAMQKEIKGLHHILEVVPRAAVLTGLKPLPAVWAFKRKCRPDFSILKWKARINVHGGHQ
jgi:hypothetical protein